MDRGSALVIAVTSLGLVAALGGAARGARVTPTLCAAHRGGALLWPENSVLAFRGAVALGADYLELDVHLSNDGEVVVIHDPSLDRTTAGTGPVRERSLAELRALRLRDSTGALTGERLPALAEVVDIVNRERRRLLLEIKLDERRRRYPAIEEAVFAILDRHGMRASTVIMAFESATLRRVRALDPSIRTTLLVGKSRVDRERAQSADVVRWAKDAGVTDLGVDHRVLDGALVEAARTAGFRVATWTVNEEPDIRRVIDLGVDIVISDRPDLALRLTRR
jgi:glycerophosphoryl diester phosphodiesterase